MKKGIFSFALIATALLVTAMPAVADGGRVVSTDAWTSEAVVPHIVDVDLRTLPPAPQWKPGDPVPVIPEQLFADFPVERIEGWVDPLRQGSTEGIDNFDGSIVVTPFASFPSGNFSPPDTVGAVGPNHYISMVNASRFAIYEKDGTEIIPPTELNTLWDQGGPCNGGSGDPIVIYDDLADRWLMQEFVTGTNNLCVYVSQGPDPVTDGWALYDFPIPSFPDYPQYGAWPGAYFVSSIEFAFGSLGLYAMDRTEMLAGNAATLQRFLVSHLNGTAPRVTRILPADVDGTTPPPVAEGGLDASGYFMRTVHSTQDSSDPTTRIEIFRFDVDFTTPANSQLVQEGDIIPAPFALLPCGPSVRDCIPQPGTTNELDALFNRPLRNLRYRNFGTHESMVTTQVVDVGGDVAGKRWWELRRSSGGEGSGFSIHQEGTYSPDNDGRFMGSIAMNGAGDIALGYSVSSDTVFPEIRVTARLADDPLGEMTMNELTLVPGDGIFTSNQRWGDYTSMDADPANDSNFWYTNMILNSSNSRTVWVGAFSLNGIFADGFEAGDTAAWDNTVD